MTDPPTDTPQPPDDPASVEARVVASDVLFAATLRVAGATIDHSTLADTLARHDISMPAFLDHMTEHYIALARSLARLGEGAVPGYSDAFAGRFAGFVEAYLAALARPGR